jgi:hypothetical protein
MRPLLEEGFRMPITPGRVAWYVTGRFYLDQQGNLQDLGYFLHLEGVQGSLFNQGSTGEATAPASPSAPSQAGEVPHDSQETSGKPGREGTQSATPSMVSRIIPGGRAPTALPMT